MTKVRVNLANPSELCEIPGIRRSQAEAIVKFRTDHGPIEGLRQLDEIMGDERLPESARDASTSPPPPHRSRSSWRVKPDPEPARLEGLVVTELVGRALVHDAALAHQVHVVGHA
jgi:hypothetical protein